DGNCCCFTRCLRSSRIIYVAVTQEKEPGMASPMSRAARGILRAAVVSLVAVVSCPVCTALAAPPNVTIESPFNGRDTSNPTPSFTGAASDITPVTVQIHAGATAKGPVVSIATATGSGGGWTSNNASPALSSGQYTAVASQPSSLSSNPDGRSEPVTVTV